MKSKNLLLLIFVVLFAKIKGQQEVTATCQWLSKKTSDSTKYDLNTITFTQNDKVCNSL